ncbi:gene transfer agent family protein [Chelatococcus sp. GCM10030263]|uniref:gene transfer agent family protein n=1 Tax=Chelatococcus sp. GCM10030263 TaxID=3273387 RepID=UPI0036158614
MSSDGSITFPWADGEYRFRLAIGQLRELQDKCSAGPAEIVQRLSIGSWRVDDVRETLRLGLIGGGLKPGDALILIKRYVDERPWLENITPAHVVLMAALVGDPDEPVGKDEAAATEPETDGSPLPPSMDQEPS